MGRDIKVNIPITINWWNEEDAKRAEVMAILVKRTLCERKYHNKLQKIIDEAMEDILKERDCVQKSAKG